MVRTGVKRQVDVSEGGKATRSLHEVELTLFNLSTCNQPTWYANFLTDNMICAGYAGGGRGTCSGDSGGPLACVDKAMKTWRLIGLTSWAKVPCAGPQSPTIFTRVSAFVPWINSVVDKKTDDADVNSRIIDKMTIMHLLK